MSPLILELLKTLGPIILGGSLLVGIAQLVKAKGDAAKARAEARKLTQSLGTDQESATTTAMREAIATMRDIAADANSSRERAEAAEHMMREELAGERAANGRLWEKLRELETNMRQKERRIVRLEGKLTSARDIVQELAAFIQRHSHGTGEIPAIDYTIFDP